MSEPEAATVLDSADVGAVAPIAGERDPACRICSFYHDENNADAAALVAARNDRWCLRHHRGPKAPLVGWFLLGPLRHCASPMDFTQQEAQEFGDMLAKSQRIVQQVTGCDRVYVIAFGEATPHLHAHLVPRFAAEPATESWRVADLYRAVESGERPAASQDAVDAAIAQARQLAAQPGGF